MTLEAPETPSGAAQPDLASTQAESSAVGHNAPWTLVLPVFGALVLLLTGVLAPSIPGAFALVTAALFTNVVTSVHHAEVIAHRVGEPLGTLVLALAVTVIEVALIVSMMLAGGEATSGLPRDTVFAAVMIILNGIIGLSLLVGGQRHHEQEFRQDGMTAALATLTVIVVFTLVLPNFATTAPGPVYSSAQLVFIAIATLVLFGGFTFVQTVRHRDYFLPQGEHAEGDPSEHAAPPTNKETLTSLLLLLIALVVVVLSAKSISPTIEAWLIAAGAPLSTLGILVAGIVLLPEGVAAVRAARHNRVQTSLNLAIGSAIASIGLTIPIVAVVTLVMDWPLHLGLDDKSTLLLFLTLFVAALSLRTGRTTVLHGLVHLVLFAAYVFLSFIP